MLYTLENEYLSLTVNSLGGSMTSLKYKGEERLHQSDEWWKGQDVVIFPVVGHAGAFTVRGKECKLKSHGLIRYAECKSAERGKNFITLTFSSDEESLKLFPCGFEFKVTYRLSKNSVTVSYFIRSLMGELAFYVGGHPGMYAPGGTAKICFEREESPIVYLLDGSAVEAPERVNGFTLDRALIAKYKTYQLGGLSGGAVSAETCDGYRYTYESDCRLYAFWTNEQGGDYVCVEPWWGINDFEGAPKELSLKPFINFDRGEGSNFSYSLTIEKN